MQNEQIVSALESDASLFKSSFEVLFNALLGMKGGGIVAWMLSRALAHLRYVSILFRFGDPLKRGWLHRWFCRAR